MNVDELQIDRRIIQILKEQGIEELYPPQAEALPHALNKENLVMAIPTAAGKTLVAYVAMLNSILREGGKALYIVPLRALANEKLEELKEFEKLGIRVKMSIGDLDSSDQHLEKYDIIVATSEKADSLLRHRTSWLSKITVLVADEIHMINDPERGPTLEVILSRFKQLNPNVQIIALSATIKNGKELADWLNATYITSDWRPVPLKKGVYLDDKIYFSDNSKLEINQKGDAIPSLVLDSIGSGGQTLIFVNTRRSAESLSEALAPIVRNKLDKKNLRELEKIAKDIIDIQTEPTTIGNRLSKCVACGVAFHNASLTNELRNTVEKNFKNGKIKCITATPTLAAGINMPARRVIIRDLYRFDTNFGRIPLPILEVHQMMGRAGRPKYDKYGEALAIAKNAEECDAITEHYIYGEPEEIYSKLATEPALRMHILSSIAMGFVKSEEDIIKFIEQTFYGYHADTYTLETRIESTLEFLEKTELINLEGQSEITATEFGKRVSDLYIDPLSAEILKEALLNSKGRSHITPFSFFHAICLTPDVDKLYLRKNDYDWLEKKYAEREKEILQDNEDYEWMLASIKTASVFEDWIEEKSEEEISQKYDIGPGDIRNKIEIATWLLYSMRELAVLFKVPCTKELSKTIVRIENGIKEELLPLIKLKNIGRVRARALFDKGFRTPADMEKADLKTLEETPNIGKKLAKNIKMQVGVDTEQAKLWDF
ncbi:MAG: DEAD/DEAH box helicase [Thermoplasmata archaeon]